MCGLITAWDPAGLTNAPLPAALGDIIACRMRRQTSGVRITGCFSRMPG
jgi:hypothetical protein